jgi:hypothetical protein
MSLKAEEEIVITFQLILSQIIPIFSNSDVKSSDRSASIQSLYTDENVSSFFLMHTRTDNDMNNIFLWYK